ncbi:cyclin-dependent protein kinase inhibitor SMR11 [Ricinus communis]|uniref:cyclin-dependent protein kinase inhibitor SMR11 n=1 Tax=Ricinus communis TaxID=3988 RepID=UPI00201AD75A|nr:cyclin-dependent protein kinase inhibitor SMR11 [Ricinus communis]
MGQLGFEKCTEETGRNQDFSKKWTDCLDESCANKPETEQSLGPITPANKENGDFSLDLSSPLTVVKKVPKALIFDSNTNQNQDPLTNIDSSSSPRTPKDGVFDPFAPGPEDKAWAPQCKKYSDEARSSVARRLNFSSSFKGLGDECAGDCVESISDEQMFESVYENLLEAIVSKQTECSLAELSKMELDSDSCLTPSSAPRLTGVADACPGAPMKPTGKSRIIDLGLCRKLEF